MATSSFLRRSLLLILLVSAFTASQAAPSAFGNGTSSVLTNDAGNVTVQDSTGSIVAQGSASDGAGGVTVLNTIWAVCGIVVGLPLVIAGLRLGRVTSGCGMGLALAVGIWASTINTVNDTGVTDGTVFILTCVFFVIGFTLGLFMPEYGIGATALGMCGGLSIGMRLALMREGLLIPLYTVNWIIICLFAVFGVLLIVWRERFGIILGSASAGTFLLVLGLDLLINKQAGMSRGLRFLMDRNAHHVVDIFTNGYHPPVSTVVLLCISLALIPPLYYAQHKLFPGPFHARKHRPSSMISIASTHSASSASFARPSLFARLTGRTGAVRVPTHPVIIGIDNNNNNNNDSDDLEKHAGVRGAGSRSRAGTVMASGGDRDIAGSDGVLIPVSADSSTAALIPDAQHHHHDVHSDDGEVYEKVPTSPVTPSSALMEEVPEATILLKGSGGVGGRDTSREHERT